MATHAQPAEIMLGTIIKRKVRTGTIEYVSIVVKRPSDEPNAGRRLSKEVFTFGRHVEYYAHYTTSLAVRSIVAIILHPFSKRKDRPKTFDTKQIRVTPRQYILLTAVYNIERRAHPK